MTVSSKWDLIAVRNVTISWTLRSGYGIEVETNIYKRKGI